MVTSASRVGVGNRLVSLLRFMYSNKKTTDTTFIVAEQILKFFYSPVAAEMSSDTAGFALSFIVRQLNTTYANSNVAFSRALYLRVWRFYCDVTRHRRAAYGRPLTTTFSVLSCNLRNFTAPRNLLTDCGQEQQLSLFGINFFAYCYGAKWRTKLWSCVTCSWDIWYWYVTKDQLINHIACFHQI